MYGWYAKLFYASAEKNKHKATLALLKIKKGKNLKRNNIEYISRGFQMKMNSIYAETMQFNHRWARFKILGGSQASRMTIWEWRKRVIGEGQTRSAKMKRWWVFEWFCFDHFYRLGVKLLTFVLKILKNAFYSVFI